MLQVFQYIISDAVRSCTYDQANDRWEAERFLIPFFKYSQGCIGIGIGLEIGKVFSCPSVLIPVKINLRPTTPPSPSATSPGLIDESEKAIFRPKESPFDRWYSPPKSATIEPYHSHSSRIT